MKRSQLKRNTKPMRRTGRIKTRRVPKEVLQLRHDWAAEHTSCACGCGVKEGDFAVIMDLHHILAGKYGRPDALWNYLRLRRECHERLGGSNNLAVCLFLKMKSDPDNYDRAAMQACLGNRRLPRAKRPEGYAA